jgi:transposase
MEKEISRLDGHYIVCGIGRVANNVAYELLKTKRTLVVIETERQVLDTWLEEHHDVLHIHADATDDDALRKAGVLTAAGVFAVTNTADLTPQEVLERYKSLADIERGFRVLKAKIEIGPVYHRLPQRIRAHAAICFMALILYRVMRAKLRAGDTKLSPERALDKLRRIQHQKIILNKTQPITGLSTITQEHNAILATLDIKKPTLDPQMSLL